MGKVAKSKQQLLEVSDTCINCNQPLALDQRFCSNCGGKRIYNRITWRNLFEDFVDRFLNIENAFLRTFLALFKKPEAVIGGYLKGMRKKYLPAFSYFAVALTVAGVSAFVIKNWFMEDMIQAQTSFYTGTTAEMQKNFTSKFLKELVEYQSVVYFAMIPILAIFSRIVFWNYKKYNLVEHFVIYLYGYSHIALITTIITLMTIWNQSLYKIFSFVSIFILIGYMTFVLKRLFELDAGNTILKLGLFCLLIGLMFLVFFVFVVILSVVAIKTGTDTDIEFLKLMKEQAEAQKALKESTQAVKDSINGNTIKQTIQVIKDTLQ
ncbi:DUF3667 domain-containing protein [uncultured Dokdonia sp.]|uniref:DUF3667 domain-containing protein n=1 Tax=uncultured Dokdonia sp. TaxID=575653 RepID=UPI00262E1726|nr:DUF3667 domain-containing protein [uncultured Dokdonia sp.]